MRSIIKPFILIAIGSLAVVASASESSKIQGYMQALMDKFCAAARGHDAAGMRKIVSVVFAPDAKIRSAGQDMTFKQWSEMMIQQTLNMKNLNVFSLQATNVRVHGNSATSLTKFHAVSMVPSPKKKTKMSKLDIQSTSDTKMEKRGGKWVIVSDMDKSNSVTLDGKPFKG